MTRPRYSFLVGAILTTLACPAGRDVAAQPDAGTATGAEPINVDLVLAQMAEQAGQFDSPALRAAGTPGLEALLDRLLPDTAPAPRDETQAPRVRQLLGQLGDARRATREGAARGLVAAGRGFRSEVAAVALDHPDPETRLRARSVLQTWVKASAIDPSKQFVAFRAHVNKLQDGRYAEPLARRALWALQPGYPQTEARRDVIQTCLSMVPAAADDRVVGILDPLLGHDDPRVAALVVSAVGGSIHRPRDFFPLLLLKALGDARPEVCRAALNWAPRCEDVRRAEEVHRAVRRIFQGGHELLKFHACFTLTTDYDDAEAFDYLLSQSHSSDQDRALTALAWLADPGNSYKPASPHLLRELVPLLGSADGALRAAATDALGAYTGREVVPHLIDRLGDRDEDVVAAARSRLSDRAVAAWDDADRAAVRQLLSEATTLHQSLDVRRQVRELLDEVRRQDQELERQAREQQGAQTGHSGEAPAVDNVPRPRS